MRKMFTKMSLSLLDLTPVHDTFHDVTLGQSSTLIRHIDLGVSCGSEDNKHYEMLTFEVASFEIDYNSIVGRSFNIKFIAVIHTAYATIKMSGFNGIITINTCRGLVPKVPRDASYSPIS
jgi:hypothetical protein